MKVAAAMVAIATASLAGVVHGETEGEHRDHAVVILSRPTTLPVQSIVESYQKTWSPKRRPEILPPPGADTATLRLTGATAVISLVRKPLSSRELGAAARASWRWPKAAETLKAHEAYVDVTVTSRNGDVVDHALTLTRLVASVLSTMSGEGVYWGNAVAVIEPKVYLELTSQATHDRPPVKIWVNFLPGVLPDKTPIVHTIGLSALASPEVVLLEQGPGSELAALNTVYKVSEYVIRNRLKLRTGDTLNISASESLRAEEIAAPWNEQETAVLLQLNSVSRRR